ncbi:SidA/IucD/PvdA family monooxygenase [Streptomyces sp. BE147]|uniref:lysine N(6)-hydroxylase/L-ornithine N(5)-oxygenase family protein n=1 Tax=Streptomyces sp. BE147 TaxID=3002524 RepID=UPI002E775507|nr:SidA/IucD/PvdA family monooxygenase [Streptomyces sp. BE147]MEE1740301.1 SidA/IucD/PvdA family monooxygenase [Streptomyces sp. BE147]
MTPRPENEPLDLLGVGVGPFNLSLAALADGVPGLRAAFHEQRASFHWHPGLLIEGSTLQVPFLADLVSLVEPTSPWSYLNYLKTRQRLFPFYFAERFHIQRSDFDSYCRWVSGTLASTHFGRRVDTVAWDAARGSFAVGFTRLGPDGEELAAGLAHARHVALGVGTAPYVPVPLRALAEDPGSLVLHSADYLAHRDRLLAARHVTVVGSGQSGAEVLLDLLRSRPGGGEGLTWLARTPAFAPMEYSKIGLEHFTPDYTRYFHGLPQTVRDQLLPRQWQLYKGVSGETLGEIHDELYRRSLDGGWPDVTLTPGIEVIGAVATGSGRIELRVEHGRQATRGRFGTDAVVLATGYRERPVDGLLAALDPHIVRDGAGRPQVDEAQRLVLKGEIGGSVFVQNAEQHTHGVGSPDLGLAAWRSAVIINALTGKDTYPLPERTAFTTFGLGGGDRSGAHGGATEPGATPGTAAAGPAAGTGPAAGPANATSPATGTTGGCP